MIYIPWLEAGETFEANYSFTDCKAKYYNFWKSLGQKIMVNVTNKSVFVKSCGWPLPQCIF